MYVSASIYIHVCICVTQCQCECGGRRGKANGRAEPGETYSGSAKMALTERDAQCVSSLWCFMLMIRGVALYLHSKPTKTEDLMTWVTGGTIHSCPSYGPALALAFWVSLIALAHPGSPTLFAIVTLLMATHQFNRMQHSLNQSYTLVFISNIAFATTCTVAAVRGQGLAVAVNAATMIIMESYAMLMAFAALGKLNSGFFDPMQSAATAHVMASIENAAAGTPLVQVFRFLVDLAGPTVMYYFFLLTACIGAVVEALVPALMYLDCPRLQARIMFAMHSLFAMTRFDFSSSAAGIMPLFGWATPGGVSSYLGWMLSPWARVVLPGVAGIVVLRRGGWLTQTTTKSVSGPPIDSMQSGGTETRKDEDELQVAKVHQLRLVCHFIFILGCPLSYGGSTIPPGTFLVGWGSNKQASQWQEVYDNLGTVGGHAMSFAGVICFAICILNCLGPYIGWKTNDSYTVLYSNIIVERENFSNHIFNPVLRLLQLPISPMRDLVTVLSSDVAILHGHLVAARIAPAHVFAGLTENPQWRNSGKYWWSSGAAPYIDSSVPGRPRTRTQDAIVILPYMLPFFQLRAHISQLVFESPQLDFYVVRFQVKIIRPWSQRMHELLSSTYQVQLSPQLTLCQALTCTCSYKACVD